MPPDQAPVGAPYLVVMSRLDDIWKNCNGKLRLSPAGPPREAPRLGCIAFAERRDPFSGAMLYNPRLTTIRQPLHKMGWTAAQLLVNRIQAPGESYPDAVWFEPELVVRESTAGIREDRPAKGNRK